ncbi:hypothetical protein TIFTF001_029403 [Ficus carica]|uniref:Uncharacterized protein n=1 Tax=Ficus carica TaxID=3494 RepID=A0AA88J3B9_FICCA|nr:hypothetical protein TIFTF001_029403 [Ficus carica]
MYKMLKDIHTLVVGDFPSESKGSSSKDSLNYDLGFNNIPTQVLLDMALRNDSNVKEETIEAESDHNEELRTKRRFDKVRLVTRS